MSTIVASAAKDVRRQRVRGGEVPIFEVEDPGRTSEALVQETQLLGLLQEIVLLLPDTYRQVIELRLYEGLSTRQTAEHLHVSGSNVTTRLNRAVQMLQRRLAARTQTASQRDFKTKG